MSGTKIFDMQKLQEGHTMVQFRVELASTSWPSQSHRDAVLSNRDYIVLLSCGHRHHRLGFARRTQYEDTQCCPIVLGRQHDIAWSSQRHRISIVFEKSRTRWHQGGNTIFTKTVPRLIFPGVTWTYQKKK